MRRMKKLFLLLFLLSCERSTTWHTPVGGDFTLEAHHGVLDTKELRGKTLFIFFGFLNCPHVCPTTIRELNRLAKQLTPKERQKVAFIFVSVDPERDTKLKLKEYFSSLDPVFIPSAGKEDKIREALKLFGGDFKLIPGKTPEETFIDHTSSVFVINRKGVWVNSVPYDASVEEFRRALDLSHSQQPYWSDEAKGSRIKMLGFNQDCDLGKESCTFITDEGIRFDVDILPRPVKHLVKNQISVRSKDKRLSPKMADLIGVELTMGLIRPKLIKTAEHQWKGEFILPTCELESMSWNLRLLLQNAEKENHEIKFRFSSINPK